jgi:hypothetical protein
MASPAVTGISVLVTEQWRRTFTGSPTPAQIKALLIAGAEDLGNTGPDYTFGYGMVNAKASVDLIRAEPLQQSVIKTSSVSQGQRYETSLRVTTAQKLRVVLQWLDPEIVFLGDDDVADKALVNDLDLTVTDATGNVILPYVLNPKTMTLSATRGTNTTDNTEELEIANATPGIYRITVVGRSITDMSPQTFTVVANAAPAPVCVDLGEANNTSETAYGNLVTTQNIGAALCNNGDVDFYKFDVTKGGDVVVVVTATGDTSIRATLSRSGAAAQTVDVPAGQSRTLTFNIAGGTLAPAVPVLLKIEAAGLSGITPTYTFTPTFGQATPAKRRSVKR